MQAASANKLADSTPFLAVTAQLVTFQPHLPEKYGVQGTCALPPYRMFSSRRTSLARLQVGNEVGSAAKVPLC
jgi:hypothetical protein